jgi:ActR/RegA family two-component response regulator
LERITAAGDFIDLADLPEQLQRRTPGAAEGVDWRPLSLEGVRKVHIQRVLDMCQGTGCARRRYWELDARACTAT